MFDTVFLFTALIGGTVLGFQFVMMLLGLGDAGGEGIDLGGDIGGADGFDLGHSENPWFYEFLSLRALSAAATFFGLAGMLMSAYGFSDMQAIVVAVLAGAAAMYAVYWLFKQVYKLQNAGNENIRNAVGQPATIYVPVPPGRAGLGKITMRLQNRTVEYQAQTDENERLATGEKVVVVAVVSSDTVRVARSLAAETSMPPVPCDASSATLS